VALDTELAAILRDALPISAFTRVFDALWVALLRMRSEFY